MSKFLDLINWKPRHKLSIPTGEVKVGDYYEGEMVMEVYPGEVFTIFVTASGERGWRNDSTIIIERIER